MWEKVWSGNKQVVFSHEHQGVLNHWQFNSLFNSLYMSNKTSKIHITGPLWEESTDTIFPPQRAINVERVIMSWYHHVFVRSLVDSPCKEPEKWKAFPCSKTYQIILPWDSQSIWHLSLLILLLSFSLLLSLSLSSLLLLWIVWYHSHKLYKLLYWSQQIGLIS